MPASFCPPGKASRLRVLVLSSLYPSRAFPRMGEVTETQTRWLAALPDIEVEVVAPVPRYPFPWSRSQQSPGSSPPQDWNDIPVRRPQDWNDIPVHRPTYTVIPRWRSRDAAMMTRGVWPVIQNIQRRRPIEIIFAQYFWPDGPAAMLLARRLGIPFSIKARGPDFLGPARRRSSRRQMQRAASRADGLLAVSRGLQAQMAALGIAPERITVHHTGVDRDRFHPNGRQEAKAALGLTGPVLLVAGNLIPRKGQLTAIEALPHIEGATLLIAGRGPDRSRLERRVVELGLEGRVRFLGLVEHKRMPLLNRAADVAVLPTREEGLANVWVEALCCGTPVVTTDVCGAREAIDSAEAGRVVSNDPITIAEAVSELLNDPPDPERVARGGRKFDWERNSRELRDHLEEAVVRYRSRRRLPDETS